MERSGAFDYILLETTGLADPGNIAPIFWLDEGLGSSIYLDGIVTVVDVKNVLKSLDEPTPAEAVDHDGHVQKGSVMTTAHLQISHGDIILLNKTDLVSSESLEKITSRIKSINGLAKIITTAHSKVPQLEGVLLDLHAYDGLSMIPNFEAKGHSHLDPTISTIAFPLPSFDVQKLYTIENWLQSLLWNDGRERDFEVYRVKGFIPLTDGSAKIVQGVREIFEIVDAKDVRAGPEAQGKIVIIGRGLESLNTHIP